jgi:hypothetical protein
VPTYRARQSNGGQLHADVVGRDHAIVLAQLESLARFIEPTPVAVFVAAELEEKIPFVTAVGQVPDKAGEERRLKSPAGLVKKPRYVRYRLVSLATAV